MSYASQAGRAQTSTTSPRAFGVCQRCGFWFNRDALTEQADWRGAALVGLRIYVCSQCLDTPQEQLRAIVVPADPTPVYWPLTEPFFDDETGNTPAIGAPSGLQQSAVMPLNGTQTNGQRLALVSVTSFGTTTVSVTCAAPHGLTTNSQIAVEGLLNPFACGFFSVTIISATAFTYQTLKPIAAAALLTPTTILLSVVVGLPLGVDTIPQV